MKAVPATLLGVATLSAAPLSAFELSHNYSFNTSTEGWQLIDFPSFSHVANPDRSAVAVDLSMGNIAPGSLRAPDYYFFTGVATPLSYNGNLSWAYSSPTASPNADTTITLATYVRYADNVYWPSMMINCGTDSLYFVENKSGQTGQWLFGGLSLDESRWTLASTGHLPTRAQFIELLKHVTAVYVRTEYHTSGNDLDDTNVDDVHLPTPLYAGDCTKDGRVNFSDLLKLAQNYGATFAPSNTPDLTWPLGDTNGDNKVNFTDLLTLAQNYGKSIAGDGEAPTFAQVTAIPEPLIVGPAALAVALAARRSCRPRRG